MGSDYSFKVAGAATAKHSIPSEPSAALGTVRGSWSADQRDWQAGDAAVLLRDGRVGKGPSRPKKHQLCENKMREVD